MTRKASRAPPPPSIRSHSGEFQVSITLTFIQQLKINANTKTGNSDQAFLLCTRLPLLRSEWDAIEQEGLPLHEYPGFHWQSRRAHCASIKNHKLRIWLPIWCFIYICSHLLNNARVHTECGMSVNLSYCKFFVKLYIVC